jgi:hypothetical protein
VPSALLPAVLVACFAHPVGLDHEIGLRALPWLPPDLARQVVKHMPEFNSGAQAAAAWPASFHRVGGPQDLEEALRVQCERLTAAIRARTPFADVVAGLGALAHLAADLNEPFGTVGGTDPYALSFAHYLPVAAPRIPLVFYGQQVAGIRGSCAALAAALVVRRREADLLGSIVREDLDRIGGPAAWPTLDDRSSTFGSASLVLNHAATDFANLASWVWYHAGGLVPELPAGKDMILVWKGEPQPREATRTRFAFRQARR